MKRTFLILCLALFVAAPVSAANDTPHLLIPVGEYQPYLLRGYNYQAQLVFSFPISEDPFAIAVDAEGNYYITYHSGNLVSYTSAGSVRWTVSGLSFPWDVAVGPNGLVYVLQYAGGNVMTYDTNGNFLGVPIKNLDKPTSMTVGQQGKIYISSMAGITTYLSNGTRTTPTISSQPEAGRMAVDDNGKLFVGREGLLSTYTDRGNPTTPTIKMPGGIYISSLALGANGNIYVGGGYELVSYKSNGVRSGLTLHGNADAFNANLIVK